MDWATADYRFSDTFGVRIGKVKTPWGLFNETQDIDPSYMWALLPQSIYDITTRNSDLAHYGGLAYGSERLGSEAGKLEYRLWGGEQVIPTNDGQFDDLVAAGTPPLTAMTYVTYGGALHWLTPVRGLMVGASDARSNQTSVALNGGGNDYFAPWNNLSYFGKYEKNKVMLAAEWNRQAATGLLTQPGSAPSPQPGDPRGWYGMASYKLTEKFSAGVYDSQMVDHQQPLGPDRYSKDWAISGRYDFGHYYLKAEQHFIEGTALSFEPEDNPAPAPSSRLTALRIGVSF